TDEPSGIPGVNILIKGTSTGAVSDIDGNYNIKVPLPESILVFSSIGYVSQEVVVGNQSTVNVQLLPDIAALEEVVVVGYTEQSRMKVTSSVSLLDETELVNIPSVSPVQALQGKLAGVSIPVLSGQPGG